MVYLTVGGGRWRACYMVYLTVGSDRRTVCYMVCDPTWQLVP